MNDIDKFEDRSPVPVHREPTTNEIILAAVRDKYDPALIEKMMDLQERQADRTARQAYVEAMAAFKSNPPKIDKDKKVEYGNTKYSHASLANVTNLINISLSQHGLSAAWKTEQNGKIIVTCTITHIFGHSESTSLSADADTSGSKNPIQAIGSTISYLERYTILALTGLATTDQDDDGNSAGAEETEFITKEQTLEIMKFITDKNLDIEKWLKHHKIETVDTLPAEWFEPAKRELEKAKARPKREPGEDG